MKNRITSILILAGLFAVGRLAAQDETNDVTSTDLKSFQIISSRNIFNPNRTGRRIYINPRNQTARVDSFTLVGTMSYEKGQYAFFDGTSSAYRKTLNLGDTIAGYKIAEIKTDYIKLAATSNQTIELQVGTQMKRPEGGRWSYVGHAEPTPVAIPDATTSTNGTPAISLPGPESDAVKRLMLKRLQEQ